METIDSLRVQLDRAIIERNETVDALRDEVDELQQKVDSLEPLDVVGLADRLIEILEESDEKWDDLEQDSLRVLADQILFHHSTENEEFCETERTTLCESQFQFYPEKVVAAMRRGLSECTIDHSEDWEDRDACSRIADALESLAKEVRERFVKQHDALSAKVS